MEITIKDIKCMNEAGYAIAIHGAHYYNGAHLPMDNMSFPWGWFLDGKEWDALATADTYDSNNEGLVFLADSLDSCYVDIHNIHICGDGIIVCDNVNIVLDQTCIEYDPTEDGYYVEKSYGDGYYVKCWRSNWNRWEETYEDAVATCDEENEAYYAEV